MRFLIKVLLLIVVTLIAGNWLLDDVGYVLIRFGNVAIETSLLIAMLTSMATLFLVGWLIHGYSCQKFKTQPSSKAASAEKSSEKHSTVLKNVKPSAEI